MTKRYVVSYRDAYGPHETRPMSLAEATETARRLRVQNAYEVRIQPANRTA